LGVCTQHEKQAVYIDTPGIHLSQSKAMNRALNRQARSALRDVDAVIFVVEALKWTKEDTLVLEDIQKLPADCPVICVINKVDKFKNKEELLPFIQNVSKKHAFKSIVPISAMKKLQIEALQKEIFEMLPQNPHFFPA